MVKTCPVCQYTGETRWRDGKNYCASCGSEIAASVPTVNNKINVRCRICGNNENNYIRDGKCICSACGSVIEYEQAPTRSAAAPSVISCECPICRTKNDNKYENGKCTCALCGSIFNYTAPQPAQPPVVNRSAYGTVAPVYNTAANKQDTKYLVLGIVFLFIFWPVSIYFFIKYAKG